MMMRPILLLATLALASCQTTGSSTKADKTALNDLPAECVVRADIPVVGAVIKSGGSEELGSKNRGRFITIATTEETYTVGCTCNDNWNMSRITRGEALALVDQGLKKEKWIRTNERYDEDGVRKIHFFEAVQDRYAGYFVYQGKMFFEGKCVYGVNGWVRRGQEPKLQRYMESIYDTRKQPPPAPAINSVPAASIETRLAAIRDLLDRKVITQQEYDERRRAILGSL